MKKRKVLVFMVLGILLVSLVSVMAEEKSEQEKCIEANGNWMLFENCSLDSCDFVRYPTLAECPPSIMSCDCGPDKCWNGETCEPNKITQTEEPEDIINEDETKNETEESLNELKKLKCDEITNMKKCTIRKDCKNVFETTKRGKRVWKGCEINPLYKAVKQKIKNILAVHKNLTDCPENCTCTGSVTKCEIEGGRVMTVMAGKSGNIIIQTKNVNATTSVVLIKNETGIFGNFSGRFRLVKYMPDEIRERVLEKLKMIECNCSTELLEDGSYEMNVERKYRILGIFPRKKLIIAKVDSENGEIVSIRRPWWGFLAVKSKE